MGFFHAHAPRALARASARAVVPASAGAPAFAFALLLFVSCASTDPFVPVDRLVEKGQFAEAAALLTEQRNEFYHPNRDRVLYYLDRGMLTHFAGDFSTSSDLLIQAERTIEELFAISITQEVATLILDERSRDYGGEDFEDIYLNLFNALNFYHRGNMESAMVEIRRSSNKLQHLSARYGVFTTNMQRFALDNDLEIPANPDAPVRFSNSALARYLGMLFYRGSGNADSARIDQQQIAVAMANAPSVYRNPIPSSIQHELVIPAGMARLNVLSFTGRSPIKREEITRIFLGNAWIRIALPVMVQRPSQIASARVTLDSGESFALELLEDIGAVVEATFMERRNVVYTRSIIRASTKGIAASAFNIAAQNSDNNRTLFTLLGIGAQVLAETTENADLRMGRFFPGQAHVGGINLAPGEHSFTITYYGANGAVIGRHRHENVQLRQHQLNLIVDTLLQ